MSQQSRHSLMSRKKNAPDARPIFQCLAMLTTSVGPMLTRQMHEVLDLMFPWGLSDALYNALQVVASHIPPLLRTIQGESPRMPTCFTADVAERLLDTLAVILTGQPFRPLGAPTSRGMSNHVSRDVNLMQVCRCIKLLCSSLIK